MLVPSIVQCLFSKASHFTFSKSLLKLAKLIIRYIFVGSEPGQVVTSLASEVVPAVAEPATIVAHHPPAPPSPPPAVVLPTAPVLPPPHSASHVAAPPPTSLISTSRSTPLGVGCLPPGPTSIASLQHPIPKKLLEGKVLAIYLSNL